MITCILFDLDGTLVDAKDWHYEALNRALEESDRHPIPRDLHLAEYDGLPTRVKLKKLGITGADAAAINVRKQVLTSDVINERCKFNPDLRRELAKLWHLGYRMAMYSNAMRASCDAMMWGSGIADYFHFWISAEEVNNPKPDPEGWLKLMSAFGVMPTQTLIVEDSAVGMASAMAAGAHLFRVQSPQDITCDGILTHIGELDDAPNRDADSGSRATL